MPLKPLPPSKKSVEQQLRTERARLDAEVERLRSDLEALPAGHETTLPASPAGAREPAYAQDLTSENARQLKRVNAERAALDEQAARFHRDVENARQQVDPAD